MKSIERRSALAGVGRTIKRMLFLAPPIQADTITLTPSDDVWVYPHASDPGRDETVRIWGAGGRSVAADPIDAEDFAYGYLRFKLPAHIKSARIVGATLELTNVINDELDPDEVAASPLEVRPLIGTFDEKSWTYTNIAKTHPNGKVVWGKGGPKLVKGEPVKISIDLMVRGKDQVGPTDFHKVLSASFPATADAEGQLALALTTTVDAAAVGMKRIYKIYTKEAEESRRPRLVLRFGETG